MQPDSAFIFHEMFFSDASVNGCRFQNLSIYEVSIIWLLFFSRSKLLSVQRAFMNLLNDGNEIIQVISFGFL